MAEGPALDLIALVPHSFLTTIARELGAPTDRGSLAPQAPAAAELLAAAAAADPERAREAIAAGAPVESCDARGMTALGIASGAGAWPVVDLLLERGADANRWFGADRDTPLHAAAHAGAQDVVRSLIARGAAIEARRRDGATPLLVAIRGNASGRAVAQALVAAGADPDAVDPRPPAPAPLPSPRARGAPSPSVSDDQMRALADRMAADEEPVASAAVPAVNPSVPASEQHESITGPAVVAAPARMSPMARAIAFTVGAAALIGGLLIAVYCSLVRVTVTVKEHAWRRTIAMEEFSPHPDSAWHMDLPAGTTVRNCKREVYRSKKIHDGTDCHFEGPRNARRTKCVDRYKDEPESYEERCDYDLLGWHPVDPLLREGKGLAPVWPEITLPERPADPAPVGSRRTGSRTAEYRLLLRGGDIQRDCTVEEAVWRRYADDDRVAVSRTGDTISCTGLR